MTDSNHLGCGFCGRPLDLCDCGVDREINYREHYREQTRSDYSMFWVFAVALALRAAFLS